MDEPPLLAQADMLFLLAGQFEPPSAESLERFRNARAEVTSFLPLAGRRAHTLATSFLRAQGALAQISLPALGAEYERLFGVRAVCPIRETDFTVGANDAVRADIARAYAAFGMDVPEERNERVDHLSFELEFFAVLLVILAGARTQSQPEAARVSEQAIEEFALAHVNTWVPVFCAALERSSRLAFYRHLARLLGEAWRIIAADHGFGPGAAVVLPARAGPNRTLLRLH